MKSYQKSCPYCGKQTPIRQCCSPECEEAHKRYHSRAVWSKRILLTTVAVCLLSLMRNLIGEPLRMVIVVVWAVILCAKHIIMPYSANVVGCERQTEKRVRITGICALVLLAVMLIVVYAVDWMAVLAYFAGRT